MILLESLVPIPRLICPLVGPGPQPLNAYIAGLTARTYRLYSSEPDYSAVPSIASPPLWMSLPTPDQVLQPPTVSIRIAKASAQKSTCLTFFTINLLFRRTSAWNIFSWTIHRYNNCCRYRLTIKKCSKNSPGPAFISFVDKPPAIRLYCRRLP